MTTVNLYRHGVALSTTEELTELDAIQVQLAYLAALREGRPPVAAFDAATLVFAVRVEMARRARIRRSAMLVLFYVLTVAAFVTVALAIVSVVAMDGPTVDVARSVVLA